MHAALSAGKASVQCSPLCTDRRRGILEGALATRKDYCDGLNSATLALGETTRDPAGPLALAEVGGISPHVAVALINARGPRRPKDIRFPPLFCILFSTPLL